jgi:hypothetical protein
VTTTDDPAEVARTQWPVRSAGTRDISLVTVGVVAMVAIGLSVTGLLVFHVQSSTRPGSGAGPGVASACNADAKTVEVAVQAFDADPPTSGGVYSIGRETGTTLGDPATYAHGKYAEALLPDYLTAWPNGGADYAISLSTTTAGEVVLYVPATNPLGVEYDLESGSTGCNAL